MTTHQLTFIHIPKTGGSSIKTWVRNNNLTHQILLGGHYAPTPADPVTNGFVVVRNPWDRIVSLYLFMRTQLSFEDYFKHKLYRDFPTGKLNQVDFIDDTTRILRFESLDADFVQIQELTGCYEPLGKINVNTRRENYQSYYTSELQNLVADMFARDIERFKYTF
jgi:hypothetical protein